MQTSSPNSPPSALTPDHASPTPPPAPPAGRLQRVLAYRLLILLTLGIFALDQATKLWIISRLPLGSYGPFNSITVIPDFFYLVHVGNTGAAWSLLTGKSSLLAFVAVATLFAIYLWRQALGLRDRLAQVAFGLLCGGIIGNLVDRIQHQHVVDFLDFHFGSYVYPTFNVADSGICVGVLLYMWHSLIAQPRQLKGK
ncbi:MAG: signal peptidase II [Cephaloticoccus sp.]|nr:signal peptidase II [Cephaloticoccus sp.]MCF7761036.1 signal peptidase II [Cephaloticoccus sp.]